MTTITDIFRTYSDDYIEKFGKNIPELHKKAIHDIVNCRTQSSGILIYECKECGKTHLVMRSCGNRHCPCCQNHKTSQWLDRQLDRQLPGHHFMITFTVPEQLRNFIRSNQKLSYSAMFDASSQTLKDFAADDRFVGGDLPGFFGVLHTWGRQLQYHPHIHYIVPGGAISKSEGKWHPSRQDFFAPVMAMSEVFRAKLRDAFKNAGLFNAVDPDIWKTGFNVNCQAVGASENSIHYLAPYVFKVAISNSRIIKVDNDRVFFKYKKSKSNRFRTMSLDVFEFMRRFLQHVLPKGFMKVRYYGFMSHNSSIPLPEIASLIEMAYGFFIERTMPEKKECIGPYCPDCEGEMVLKACIIHYVESDSGFI